MERDEIARSFHGSRKSFEFRLETARERLKKAVDEGEWMLAATIMSDCVGYAAIIEEYDMQTEMLKSDRLGW